LGIHRGGRGFYRRLREGLIAHAEHQFSLDIPDEKGNTGRQSLQMLLDRAKDEATAARYADDLSGPECPDEARYLFLWFLELHRARAHGGMGPGAIGYPDIHAWCGLRGITLAPWEVEILTALDHAWLVAQSKAVKRGS